MSETYIQATLDKKLLEAIKNKDLNKCIEALKEGADVNTRLHYYSYGTPLNPLMYANERNSQEDINIYKLLLEYGADITARDYYGNTALHTAAYCGNIDLCKLLIEKGININIESAYKQTPLFHAIRYVMDTTDEVLELIQYMIDSGADVNFQSECGSTPLHFAVYRHNAKVCKLLIDNGAYVSIKNDEGHTPKEYADNANYYVIYDILNAREKELEEINTWAKRAHIEKDSDSDDMDSDNNIDSEIEI